MPGDQLEANFRVFTLNVPTLTKLEFGVTAVVHLLSKEGSSGTLVIARTMYSSNSSSSTSKAKDETEATNLAKSFQKD